MPLIRMGLSVFAVALVAIASAQLLIKWRFGVIGMHIEPGNTRLTVIRLLLTDGWLWTAGTLMIVGAVSWYLAMTQLPLTLMMPLASLVAPLVAFGAHFFLGEPLNGSQMAAIVLIAAGAAWLGYQQTS